jgi:hypothetical protein
MDPVQDDVKHAGNHDALTEKRNTAMHQQPWAMDGKENELPAYQHGDPMDDYSSKDLNKND